MEMEASFDGLLLEPMTSQTMGVYWEGALPFEPRRKDTLRTVVEGLNVINDPKCNKLLNVITICPKCNKLLRYKLQ